MISDVIQLIRQSAVKISLTSLVETTVGLHNIRDILKSRIRIDAKVSPQ
jgi:hypothetical protein